MRSPSITRLPAFVLGLLTILLSLNQCSDECKVRHEYVYYEPIYTTLQELRSSVSTEPVRELTATGKIYFKDDYLFVNEPGDGIHVIDNRNPSAPVKVSFINIPGNFDLAILNNTLFADSFIDLVAIDISDVANAKEVARYENLFSNYSSLGFSVDPVRGVVTDWKMVSNVTVNENACDQVGPQPENGYYLARGGVMFDAASSASFNKTAAIAPGNSTGIAGSMARFAIQSDYLFALNGASLDVVSIANPNDMQLKKDFPLSWDIETIFPREDKLFIGSRTGMHIINISNPEAPEWISTFSHLRSCDPVVVEGNYAFVTLRDANTCTNTVNELQVVNIENLQNPTLVKTYAMTNPHGLGIDNSVLFICDGRDGLKIYNSQDVLKIAENKLAHYMDIQAFDIIPFDNIAMMIAEDGLYQYDYSNLDDIKFLSKLSIVEE